MFYTITFQFLDFDTKVELNMFFTCGIIGGGVGIERGGDKH